MATPRFAALVDYTAALAAKGVDARSLVADDKGTLARATLSRSATRNLTPLTLESQPEIVVGEALSRGAQGEVWLAEQRSLGRTVAVKVPRPARDGTLDADRAQALLVEARVSGQLEHPNIVPVHIIGADDTGRPLLVMKRVEGATWKALRDAANDLDRDVEVLIAICRALAFAHQKGIAHCDVKPANVMVGPHGDIYLVDWGVAVGFGKDAPRDVPHAKDITGVFGTPKYLAPEMALPTGGIDHRTDVYLCGAVLFEILNGRPLHEGKSTEAVLHAAHVAEIPPFVDDAPEELVAIVRRAVAREKTARFASADELRLALQGYLEHKTARALCVAAAARLSALRDTPAKSVDDDLAAQRLFSECRFGFEMALSSWPESKVAADGRDACLTVMARREVARGHLAQARMLVHELRAVPDDLALDIDALAARVAKDEASRLALEAFAREQDLTVAERERAFAAVGSGLAWLVTMLVVRTLDTRGIWTAGPGVFSAFMALFAVTLVVVGRLRPAVRQTERARGMWTTFTAVASGLAMLHAVAWRAGLSVGVSLAMGHVLYAVAAVMLTTQDRRLWPTAAIASLNVVGLLVWPTEALLISGIGGFAMLAAVGVSFMNQRAR